MASYVALVGYVRRSSLGDGYFHVWMRGTEEVPPFPSPDDKTAALGMLLKAAKQFEVRVEAACVMSTHYHAIVMGTSAQLSRMMQWLHSRYARAFNRRRGRHGHVFSERFQSKPVTEDGVWDRCAYVVGNPVKAGLCATIRDWPWSYCRRGLEAF